MRIIVLKNIAAHPRNAAWNLFSAQLDKIKHGANSYTWQQQATIMQQLFRYYKLEAFIDMAYTYEQFEREFKQEIKHEIFQEFKEEFLQQYKNDLIQSLDVEERLRGLKADDILETIAASNQLRLLRAEERLLGMLKIHDDIEAVHLKTHQDELLQTLSTEELTLLLTRLVNAGQLSQEQATELQQHP